MNIGFYPVRVLCAVVILTLGLVAPAAFAVVIFNLSGSHFGNGDVVGPYQVAKAYGQRTGEDIALLVDERALEILRSISGQNGLALNRRLEHMKLIGADDLKSMTDVSVVFELFAQARSGKVVPVLLPEQASPPLFVRTQDLHYGSREQSVPKLGVDYLSEIRFGDRRWFFSPAGLGGIGGGVLPDEDVKPYVPLTPEARRALAAGQFSENSLLHLILSGQRFRGARLGFAYGLGSLGQMFSWTNVDHAEEKFMGQFLSYARGAVSRLNGKPMLILTPNSPQEIYAEFDRPGAYQRPRSAHEPIRVVDARALGDLPRLDPVVYIVSTGRVTRPQMVGLMASSDEPVLFEGDGTLSTAVQLGQPFAMMRSPWGYFAVDGIRRALLRLGAAWARDVYPVPDRPPALGQLERLSADREVFRRLAASVPHFDETLFSVVELATRKESSLSSLLKKTNDPVLKVSILEESFSRGQIEAGRFTRELRKIEGSGDLLEIITDHQSARPLKCSSFLTIKRRFKAWLQEAYPTL